MNGPRLNGPRQRMKRTQKPHGPATASGPKDAATGASHSWKLPSGQSLSEFAFQSGFPLASLVELDVGAAQPRPNREGR